MSVSAQFTEVVITTQVVQAVPFRPGYETALWILNSARDSPWRGRVLLADGNVRTVAAGAADRVATVMELETVSRRVRVSGSPGRS